VALLDFVVAGVAAASRKAQQAEAGRHHAVAGAALPDLVAPAGDVAGKRIAALR
jgi:hypothetical protein